MLCLARPTDAQTPLFSLIGTASAQSPEAYCDIVTFTLKIKNLGAASTFTGEIEFRPYDWQIINYGGLPNATADFDPQEEFHYLFFTTHSLATSEELEVSYQFISKAHQSANFSIEHYVTRTANQYTLLVEPIYTPIQHKPIPYPGYSSVHVSDILDDYDGGNGPFILYPPDPVPPSSNDACNTPVSIYISDELVVDVPTYCLLGKYPGSLDEDILVGPGGRIVVESGSALLIENMYLRSCDTMWKGIYVETGGRLTIINSHIAHAQYGIQAERGATVNVTGTTFENNYVGFYISPFVYQPDPESPQLSYVKSEAFYNNLFICTGDLLLNYTGQSPAAGSRSYAGIEVHYTSQWRVPGHVDGLNGHANFFESLSNGIIATHSSLYLGDIFFKDIHPDPESPYLKEGYGVHLQHGKHLEVSGNTIGTFQGYGAHFDDVRHGIWSSGASVSITGMTMADVETGIVIQQTRNRVIGIHDNTIHAEDVGILLNHCIPINGHINNNSLTANGAGEAACIEINDCPIPTRWNVEDNILTLNSGRYGLIHRTGYEFAVRNNTIFVNPYPNDEGYGIYLDGSKRAQVSCNQLTGDIVGTTYRYSRGIFGSGAEEFDVACNSVEDFRFGINFAGECSGSLLRGNTIGDQWNGLMLGRDPDDGNVVIGVQNHVGNIWSGDYINLAATLLNSTPEAGLASAFTVNPNENSNYLPHPISGPANWIRTTLTGDAFECESSEICPEGIGFIAPQPRWDSLDYKLASENIPFEYFESPMNWTGRFHLYRRLHDAAILLPTHIDSFLTVSEADQIGHFARLLDTMAYALKYNGNLESYFAGQPLVFGSLLADIAILDTLLASNPDDAAALALLTLKLDSLATEDAGWLDRDSVLMEIMSARLLVGRDAIDRVSADSAWEQEMLFVLSTMLNLVATDTLSGHDDLLDLALDCPDKHADAGYIARSLLRADSARWHYDDADFCSTLYPRSDENHEKRELHTLSLRPNPAADIIWIGNPEEGAEIRIIDAHGKVLYKSVSIDNEIRISTIGWPAGLYTVHARTASGIIHASKFLKL